MNNSLPLLINSYFNFISNSNNNLFNRYNNVFSEYINNTFNNPIDNSINTYLNDIQTIVNSNDINTELMNEINSLLSNNLYNTASQDTLINNNITNRNEELDYHIINKNKNKTYNLKKVFILNKNKKECNICLDYINDNACKLNCKHLFHINCIKKWININASCPICRKKIKHNT